MCSSRFAISNNTLIIIKILPLLYGRVWNSRILEASLLDLIFGSGDCYLV